MRKKFRLAAAVVDQFAGRVGETDELGVWENGRRAIAELAIKLASDHEHHISFSRRHGPHGADDCGFSAGTSPRLSCVSR